MCRADDLTTTFLGPQTPGPLMACTGIDFLKPFLVCTQVNLTENRTVALVSIKHLGIFSSLCFHFCSKEWTKMNPYIGLMAWRCAETQQNEKRIHRLPSRWAHMLTLSYAYIAPPSLSTDGHQYLDLPLQTAMKNAWRYIGRCLRDPQNVQLITCAYKLMAS